MDIVRHGALVCAASRLLLRGSHAALAQHYKRVFHVPLRLLQGFQAVAHGRSGLLAELLHQLRINLSLTVLISLPSCQLSVISCQFLRLQRWRSISDGLSLAKRKRGCRIGRPRCPSFAHLRAALKLSLRRLPLRPARQPPLAPCECHHPTQPPGRPLPPALLPRRPLQRQPAQAALR